MKKLVLIALVFVFALQLVSCSNEFRNASISEDYSKVFYNNKEYALFDYYIGKPDDAIEVDSSSDVISYDVIYLSKTCPDFLWLETTTDYTENKKFQDVLHGNVVVYKKV